MQPPKEKGIFIKTFGCQMNVYDSNRMQGLLKNRGYRLEDDVRKADVIVVNTCAIRDKSEHKVLSLLGQLRPLKEKNPNLVLGISGCVGQRMGRTLLQRVPYLDLVFGPDSVERVGELIDEVVNKGQRIVEAKFDEDGRRYTQPAIVHAAKPAELLTIVKGCDHFCTYCIVPFTRGREKSRAISEIIEDVRKYVEKGTKEITFLGQNINTYGKGTGETLAELIEQADKVDGLEIIRYLTSHPRDLGDDLINQFGRVEKLAHNLHLPIQSGSDPVLKRMSRLYTQAEYLRKIEKLKAACPDLALSTDIIVGFPGETEEDFDATIKVLNEVGFSQSYLFKYSPRPGTRATSLGEEVPESVKDERLARAFEVTNKYVMYENSLLLGKVMPVLVEKLDKKGLCYSGRNSQNKIVHILNAGEACVGKIIDVEITATAGSNLRGYYVGAPRDVRTTPSAFSSPLQEAAN